jgi:hypothetical protein
LELTTIYYHPLFGSLLGETHFLSMDRMGLSWDSQHMVVPNLTFLSRSFLLKHTHFNHFHKAHSIQLFSIRGPLIPYMDRIVMQNNSLQGIFAFVFSLGFHGYNALTAVEVFSL